MTNIFQIKTWKENFKFLKKFANIGDKVIVRGRLDRESEKTILIADIVRVL